MMIRKAFVLALAGLALLLGLATAAQGWAGDAATDRAAMLAANQLVETGHTAEAIRIYQALLEQGAQDAALFYNLGNAYFQQGDLGPAVAAYQQAAELAPRDRDIRANLALARSQAGIASQASRAGNPLATLSGLTGRWLTLNELALLALGAWFLLGFLVLARRLLRDERAGAALRYAIGPAVVIVALSGLALAGRLATTHPQPAPAAAAPQAASIAPAEASIPEWPPA